MNFLFQNVDKKLKMVVQIIFYILVGILAMSAIYSALVLSVYVFLSVFAFCASFMGVAAILPAFFVTCICLLFIVLLVAAAWCLAVLLLWILMLPILGMCEMVDAAVLYKKQVAADLHPEVVETKEEKEVEKAEKAEEEEPQQEHWICPSCGMRNSATSNQCKGCSSTRDGKAVTVMGNQPSSKDGYRQCSCGAWINTTVCPLCGKKA